MPLQLPKSRAEIRRIQAERKRFAVEQARRAPFWRSKLEAIDLARLDDPDEWRKIPILDKDTLRGLARHHGELGGLGHVHPVGVAARTDPAPEAHAVARHVELRPAPRQPR